MYTFTVTIHTATRRTTYTALARTPWDAELSARSAQGDTPCGITVTPARAAQ